MNDETVQGGHAAEPPETLVRVPKNTTGLDVQTVTGVVVRCRRMGKHLMFITVDPNGAAAAAAACSDPEMPAQADNCLIDITIRDPLWIKQIKPSLTITLRARPEHDIGEILTRSTPSEGPIVHKLYCVQLLSVSPAGSAQVSRATKRKRSVSAPTPPCKWFLQGKPCQVDGCARRHQFASLAEERQALAKRQSIERYKAHGVVDSGVGRQHSKRGAVFGEWLVATYGVEHLRSGSGVLDVAGGKQFVSLYLATVHGVPCTVVDPRPPAPLSPADELVLSTRGHPAPRYIQGSFDSAFADANAELLGTCSVVCGQHPDEATEPIVSEALRFRKPFAVVPCCVFAKLFPRALDGVAVTQYDDFLRYLEALAAAHVEVSRTEIPLTGRNTILYSLPNSAKLTRD
eukprot:m.21471 g.21471  ORF g.21471 m.21471 type:complete len:402 (+) comp5698_c0_seq2:51-1256(+)